MHGLTLFSDTTAAAFVSVSKGSYSDRSVFRDIGLTDFVRKSFIILRKWATIVLKFATSSVTRALSNQFQVRRSD